MISRPPKLLPIISVIIYRSEHQISRSITNDWISTPRNLDQVSLQVDCIVLYTHTCTNESGKTEQRQRPVGSWKYILRNLPCHISHHTVCRQLTAIKWTRQLAGSSVTGDGWTDNDLIILELVQCILTGCRAVIRLAALAPSLIWVCLCGPNRQRNVTITKCQMLHSHIAGLAYIKASHCAQRPPTSYISHATTACHQCHHPF